MTDEKYIYHKDIAEKKRTARGSYNRLSHAGKSGMKTPSDYLTKRERDKMNGEVQSYNLSVPMDWEQFKKMPPDIKGEYLNGLIDKFSPTQTSIAKMLGISNRYLNQLCTKELNIRFEHSGRQSEKKDRAFWEWVNSFAPAEQIEADVEIQPQTQNKDAGKPTSGMLVFTDTTAQDAFNAAYMLITASEMKSITISWEVAN